jgi:hypothetical protein
MAFFSKPNVIKKFKKKLAAVVSPKNGNTFAKCFGEDILKIGTFGLRWILARPNATARTTNLASTTWSSGTS